MSDASGGARGKRNTYLALGGQGRSLQAGVIFDKDGLSRQREQQGQMPRGGTRRRVLKEQWALPMGRGSLERPQGWACRASQATEDSGLVLRAQGRIWAEQGGAGFGAQGLGARPGRSLNPRVSPSSSVKRGQSSPARRAALRVNDTIYAQGRCSPVPVPQHPLCLPLREPQRSACTRRSHRPSEP